MASPHATGETIVFGMSPRQRLGNVKQMLMPRGSITANRANKSREKFTKNVKNLFSRRACMMCRGCRDTGNQNIWTSSWHCARKLRANARNSGTLLHSLESLSGITSYRLLLARAWQVACYSLLGTLARVINLKQSRNQLLC